MVQHEPCSKPVTPTLKNLFILTSTSLPLVANRSQKLLACRHVLWTFDTLGRHPIDHTDYSTPVFCFRHYHPQGIRGHAEDGANLWNVPQNVQQVDWIGIAQHEDKYVPRSQHLCIPNRNRLELVVIPVGPLSGTARKLH